MRYRSPSTRPMSDYRFHILKSRGVPSRQLDGTAYRFWSAHAVADVLARRLRGRIDFLDAGGRDGALVELLANLGLSGHYTCLDLAPVEVERPGIPFEIEYVRSSFRDFRPTRRYDAVLFMSSLEFVRDYRDIGWLTEALKPDGFVVATVIVPDTERLYRGFWEAGGRYGRDRDCLVRDFSAVGLETVELYALVGWAGRVAQSLVQLRLMAWQDLVQGLPIRRLYPGRKVDLTRTFNRIINELTARLDRHLPFGRIGHCIVLQRAGQTS